MQVSATQIGLAVALVALVAVTAVSSASADKQPSVAEVERAVLAAAAQAAPAPQQQQGESYQGIYDAFTKLMQSMSNNSLANVRRLVQRLNNLVGATGSSQQQVQSELPQQQQRLQQSMDEKTEQILQRLDNVNKNTDQHTLAQLNDDVTRLISTMNDSYLRNIRRVIERVNKVVGQPAAASVSASVVAHQTSDSLDDPAHKQPGFPGWDEFIVAMDRMQKSLASFLRSSTRLITSG